MQTSRPRLCCTIGTLAATIAVVSALAISTLPAGAGTGARVFIFGNGTPASTLTNVLRGFTDDVATVEAGTVLPADLSVYDVIWHVGLTAPSGTDQGRLAAFLASGGGLHITGEPGSSCCSGLQAFVNSVVADGGLTATSRTFSAIAFNPTARDQITTFPNALGTLTGLISVGELGGLTGDNVLAFTSNNAVAGGVWGPDDLTNGAGRLTVMMDVHWIYLGTSAPRVRAIRNVQEFLHEDNAPPVVSVTGPVSGTEGAGVSLHGSAVDPDGDAVTLGWTWAADAGVDAGATCSFSDAAAAETAVSCTDDGVFSVTLIASDGVNAPVAVSTSVQMANAAPLVTLHAPDDATAVPVGWPVEAVLAHTDPGTNDTHSCAVDWGDGTGGPCTEAHAYAAPGVYVVTVNVVDDDGGTGEDTSDVAVYDPDGGFVTGGGVAGGPPGVPFSLAARYAQGSSAPTGHFRLGSFQADSFAWLVVDTTTGRAEVAGVGTHDGVSGLAFRLTVSAGRGRAGGSLELRVDGVASTAAGPQPVRGNLGLHAH